MKQEEGYNVYLKRRFFFFLAILCGLWDLGYPTRYWTWAPLVEVPSLNHWTTRKIPSFCFFNVATRKIKIIIRVYLDSCSHVWIASYFYNSASEQGCESFQELVLTSLPPQFILPTLIFPFLFLFLHFILFQQGTTCYIFSTSLLLLLDGKNTS